MAFGACAPFEKDLIRKDNHVLSSSLVALHDEEIVCFVSTSARTKCSERLNHLAYHDARLIPNCVILIDQAGDCPFESEHQIRAVLMLNLDRFKTINDSLGYTAGDYILRLLLND